MKIINIRESLMNMDKQTYCKYDLTTMYESLSLSEEKKKQLVKYIDAYDIDATNKFLGNECSSQGLMEFYEEDDFGDDELASIYGGDTKYPDAEECGVEDTACHKKDLSEARGGESLLDKVNRALANYEPEESDTFVESKKGKGSLKDTVNKALKESVDQATLDKEIRQALIVTLQDMGFDQEDIDDYSVVEVTPTEDGNALKVEVRFEIGYNGLEKLANSLDPVVQEYDENAYFEPVTSGIIEAFVTVDSTQGTIDVETADMWKDRFASCNTLEELKDAYQQYRVVRDTLDNATISEINTVLDPKIDILTSSSTMTEGKLKDKIKNYKTEMDIAIQQKNNKEKDKMGNHLDKPHAVMDKKKEIYDMDTAASGKKLPNQTGSDKRVNNKKTSTKSGNELKTAIDNAAKKGGVYLADIGESLNEDTDSEFNRLKNTYKHCQTFSDIDKNSGEINDLLDRLQGSGISYEEYKHKTDNGITIFHESMKLREDISGDMIPEVVAVLFDMDRFVMDVYDNEGWLMNGIPDGEFEENTAEEAKQNYQEHDWLVTDFDGVFDEESFNDFIDTFENVTVSKKDYDQEERAKLISRARALTTVQTPTTENDNVTNFIDEKDSSELDEEKELNEVAPLVVAAGAGLASAAAHHIGSKILGEEQDNEDDVLNEDDQKQLSEFGPVTTAIAGGLVSGAARAVGDKIFGEDIEEDEIDAMYHDCSEDELRKMGAFDNLNDDDTSGLEGYIR